MTPEDDNVAVPATRGIAFGLSEEDFALLRSEGIKAFREALNPILNRTIDEFLAQQTGSPFQLNADHMNRLAARYCEAVRQGAKRLAKDLGDAIGNRQGLGTEALKWIETCVDCFISELTSSTAVHDLFEGLVQITFTVANPREAEQMLSESFSKLDSSGLLTKKSDEALKLAIALRGSSSARLEEKGLETAASYPKAIPTGERKSFVLPILDKKGWSILDWAHNSGVDFNTASNYLKGKTKPYKSTRAKLANSLGVEVLKLPT
jgi:hypothetical protein